jgi:nitrite reductase/ring-hydroxylating ferredoxin subunit
LVKHGAFKAMRQQLRKIPQPLATGAIAQTPAAAVKTETVKRIALADIPEGGAKLVRANGEEMAVFKNDGKVFGVQNSCPHEGGQLCKGWLEAGEVVCPLHGYKFNLQSGICSTDPKLKIKVFKLVAQGDGVTVEE